METRTIERVANEFHLRTAVEVMNSLSVEDIYQAYGLSVENQDLPVPTIAAYAPVIESVIVLDQQVQETSTLPTALLFPRIEDEKEEEEDDVSSSSES
jgi:hypothetical protein